MDPTSKRPKRRMRNNGRPRKLTAELGDRILEVVARGNYHEPAARSCGVKPSTLKKWKSDGRAKGPLEMRCPRCRAVRKAACVTPKGEACATHAVRQRAYDDAGIYRDFVAALMEATDEAEVHHVDVLHRISAGDTSQAVRASVEYLARKGGSRWLKTERREHTGAGGGPVSIDADIDVDQGTVTVVRFPINNRDIPADCARGEHSPLKGSPVCELCGKVVALSEESENGTTGTTATNP